MKIKKPNVDELNKRIQNAISVILNSGIINNMDNVWNFIAFKVRVENRISKDNNGSIYMGDINSLASLIYKTKDDAKVDKMICNLIKIIRETLKSAGIKDYEIGKQGDEIYIYIPNNVNSKEILSNLNRVSSSDLTISFGVSEDLSQGLDHAIHLAEIDMMEEKTNRKRREQIEKKDNESSKQEWLKNIDFKLRIDVARLTEEQKKIYYENKRDCINYAILNYDQITKDEESLLSSNLIKLREKKYFEEQMKTLNEYYAKKYDGIINKKQIEVLTMASMLHKQLIKGVESTDFFESKGFEILKGKSKLGTLLKLKKSKLFSINIGKVKYINDRYGHSECDKMIYEIIEILQNATHLCGVEKKGLIISNGISEYHMIIDSSVSEANIKKLQEMLQTFEKKKRYINNKLF